MRRLMTAALVGVALSTLVACGETLQTLDGESKKDTAAFNGTGSRFVAEGWKPGDKSSWEQHLRARMQNSQNEYSKVN